MAKTKFVKKVGKRLARPLRNQRAKDLRKARNEYGTKGGPVKRIFEKSLAKRGMGKNPTARVVADVKARKRQRGAEAALVGFGAGALAGLGIKKYKKRKSASVKKKSYSIRRSRKRDNRRRDRLGRFR